MKTRVKIEEIAERLGIGRPSVYALLEQGEIPGIRIGRKWIITRFAYENWERTCGTRGAAMPEDEAAVSAMR